MRSLPAPTSRFSDVLATSTAGDWIALGLFLTPLGVIVFFGFIELLMRVLPRPWIRFLRIATRPPMGELGLVLALQREEEEERARRELLGDDSDDEDDDDDDDDDDGKTRGRS